ncbi:MAG: hypothetical protein AABX47_04885 [Nanoarchaeota archaeon]
MDRMEHFPTVDRLHTDVLEGRYGEIRAKVIRHDDLVRESHLIDSSGASRTYALTFFMVDSHSDDIRPIDLEIRSGGSIGATFRRYGYAIRKNVLDVFILEVPDWLAQDFHHSGLHAKSRISEFYAKKQGAPSVLYGDVLEVYSPDFRPPLINKIDYAQINPSADELQREGFSLDDILARIENGNDWSDVAERYERARIKSLGRVFGFRRRIEEYLRGK